MKHELKFKGLGCKYFVAIHDRVGVKGVMVQMKG